MDQYVRTTIRELMVYMIFLGILSIGRRERDRCMFLDSFVRFSGIRHDEHEHVHSDQGNARRVR